MAVITAQKDFLLEISLVVAGTHPKKIEIGPLTSWPSSWRFLQQEYLRLTDTGTSLAG